MVMIYAFGETSGAHFNPAINLNPIKYFFGNDTNVSLNSRDHKCSIWQ